MLNIFVEILTARHELFGGYAYLPYASAIQSALYKDGRHVAHEAVKESGNVLVASKTEADLVLKVLERCPCCAGGVRRTSPNERIVCPLPGIDNEGEQYDFWMKERISFWDPEHPQRQSEELATGESIPAELWRRKVIEGISKVLA